jgi:2-haloacid dehalogenase
VLFIDDTPANVAAARRRGWDAILFTDNAALFAELGARGLP